MRRAIATLALGCLFNSCAPPARTIRSADETRSGTGLVDARKASSSASPSSSNSPSKTGAQAESRRGALPLQAGPPDEKANAHPSTQSAARVALFDGPPLPSLASFYRELTKLAWGERASPVRIYWLGDSHTAADFMTHTLRRRLERFVRAGGPGFVRVGLDGYRHGAVSVRNQGRFRKAPILPAQRTRVLDGVFGYGGIRTLPTAGASSRLEYRPPSEVPEDSEMQWTLSARLPPGASLRVRLGEQETPVNAPGTTEEAGFVSLQVQGPANQPLTISHRSGSPEIFGVFGELTTPGVVLDTVGINGARAATPLAWEPERHAQAVARRAPDLLVLAFGTNEVFDRGAPERYTDHTTALVRRVRLARPGVPCWIIGPPDAGTSSGASRSRVADVTAAQRRAAAENDCSFTSAAELMGGEGAFRRWMSERPALARSDYIHLTIAGYERLGSMLADALLGPELQVDPVDDGLARFSPVDRMRSSAQERSQRPVFWRSRYPSYSFISAR